ncbi:MAG: type II toxin-antitoxin system VapB family antitoxin [Bacillota bacterium]|nr:type II toxin-antitoxin system VapB family antitoxin [Bacillota bacterium]
METAKLFANGQSQAVRLPKEYRFLGSEVYIQKVGHVVMLFPKDHAWETFLNGLNSFTDDFLADGRDQGDQAPRETL